MIFRAGFIYVAKSIVHRWILGRFAAERNTVLIAYGDRRKTSTDSGTYTECRTGSAAGAPR